MVVNLIISSLMLGGIYGLIGLGYSIIYRASGLMNFAQSDMFMLGAFMGLTFYDFLGFPFAVSLILSMITLFIIGFCIQKGVIQFLQKKNAPAMYLVLGTIAISIIFKNFATIAWENRIFAFPSIFSISSIKVSGISITPESILAVVLSFICMVALHLFMSKTKFGTAMRAAAQDRLAAQACGIDVSFTTGFTWGLAGSAAALAGILYSPGHYVIANMATTIGQRGFSSAVIGGYGNMYGAIIGGMIIAFIETFTAAYISSNYKNFITFGILMIFLFVRPTGIMNEQALKE